MADHNDTAFVEYVSSRLLHLRRTAYLLCGDWSRGDDLVQRALTDVYVRWARVREASNVDGYVRTVLVHRFVDEQRRGWARVRLLGTIPDRPAVDTSDPAIGLDLRSALVKLPPRQRAVLVLRFFCDMSVEQTAEALGCATGTVKSQTSLGLAAMRRLLVETESGTR
jgi:RNA polymerase sigma-70 factor (sigma-E family)